MPDSQPADCPDSTQEHLTWFVLRDLTRPIAKLPGYKKAISEGYEVFTPMKWVVKERSGKRERVQIPVIHDLLFVHSTRERLDTLIAKTKTLQYRFAKGLRYCEPMTVKKREMDRFIEAVRSTDCPKFYSPEEINGISFGKKIKLVCEGVLNGYEGELIAIKGGRKKRLLVRLPGILAVEYEVSPDYIQYV